MPKRDRYTYIPRRLRPRVVYFVQNTETGHIKIGQSCVVAQRLNNLKSAVGKDRFRVLGVAPGTRETEHELHKRFSEDAIGHEWFRSSTALLALIEVICVPSLLPSPAPRKPRVDARPRQVREGIRPWAPRYDRCRFCGTDSVPHVSHGKCRGCYFGLRSEAAEQAAPALEGVS